MNLSNNKISHLLLLLVAIITASACSQKETTRYLVQDGKPVAVIVNQDPLYGTNEAVSQAIEDLQYHLERAAGVRLPVVRTDQLVEIPENHVRILIGPGQETRKLGLSFETFSDETYRMKAVGNYLILTGRKPESILWSVHRFLDRFMGVRWLWPGEIGTFVPQTSHISYPADLDITDQPPLQWRNFSMRPPADLRQEISEWLTRHMTGSGNLGTAGDRGNLRVGHSFTHWAETYYDEHPDLFAQERGPHLLRRTDDGRIHHNVNLCLSNPKVDEFIIAEWQEAGTPDFWNVGNNDLGGRYCLCDDCLAMDIPPGQSMEDIWAGTCNVTARHVRFWRRLLDKMQKINPSVTIGAYAFQQYRFAPPPDTDLRGMVISVVSAHDEQDYWLAWHNTGAKLYLRPNWWHTGVVAPHIPLNIQGDYFKFAFEHGMLGFHFDSLIGYWGAQGPSYYLITRLGYRPDLSVEDIISEYTDAFGSAKPAIREYLDYWEKRTELANYRLRSTDMHPPREGLYDTIVREKGLTSRVQLNNWLILPWLYPDEVTGEAHAILDRADRLAANDGEFVKKRIQFLRDGLRYLEASREVFRLGIENARPDDSEETWLKYVAAREKLEGLRYDVISPHVVWDGISERERDYRSWRMLWERNP